MFFLFSSYFFSFWTTFCYHFINQADANGVLKMSVVKKELTLFVAIFFILAIGMHFKEWVDHPIAHIEALPKSPLGPLHPLYITVSVYLFFLVGRLAIRGIMKLFK
ncbi:hypothetical protein [Hydrogenimonas urashimensis]|uniref:hypothetical protein n=1 Tax=Hydrogenimonas urashimensis TaxID=2740515 RepID=UPI001F2F701B|nr:hypothetical protein [Hydrogenimonas urashimensis]